jgi:CheY-like chemotaxis protein
VPPVTSGQLNGLSILVVDDDEDVRELVAYLLEASGAEVHLAEASMPALALLARHSPDVLISDIAMPEEDGYALMRRVRTLAEDANRRVPAIALTAFTRDIDRRRALAAGFDVHMAKPLDPATLVKTVRDLARQRAAPSPP